MPSLAIIDRLMYEVRRASLDIPDSDIHLVPAIMWVHASKPWEVQVAITDYTYGSRDGRLRHEQFGVIIGLIQKIRLDYSGRYDIALTHEDRSLFKLAEAVVDQLDLNRLNDGENDLLLQPLHIVRQTDIQTNKRYPGVLIKELLFRTGTIEAAD